MVEKENNLQVRVANYLRRYYPSIIFHSDFGSGVRLSKWQAVMNKKQNGGLRGYPDMFICKSSNGKHGLFLELKRDGVKLRKKNGEWSSEHIKEQAEMLAKLQSYGYEAYFAIGFDNAINIIDAYLKKGGVSKYEEKISF